MSVVAEVWERIFTTQPPPPDWVVTAAALAAALLVLTPRSWLLTRHVVTIAHEAGHGLAALLTGRRLVGIRLHSDTSGVTVSAGPRRGPGMVVTAAAGYLGPALVGVSAATLVGSGHAVGALWALLVLLALLLVQIRNWFGLWAVLGTAGGIFAVSWSVPERGQSAVAYAVSWFLLFAAPRPVVELQAARRRRRARNSDADQLARLTGVPAIIWVGIFFAATVGAALLGTRLLIA